MPVITSAAAYDSPARVHDPERGSLRVGLVQHRWRADPAELVDVLTGAIGQAADGGAKIVFLPELTLSRYPADTLPTGVASDIAEDLMTGPTFAFATAAAARHEVLVHASLYQKADAADGLGLNTAFVVNPAGELVARTHKLHIPVTEGYYEDKFFRPGPANPESYAVHRFSDLGDVGVGLPTCWDEWFPEVARIYALGGADLLAYPTAIGSEPGHPAFDTQPLWQQVIVGHAISNGVFIAVPNRIGHEGLVEFYGSSFIVDPYGRILAQAPRDTEAVLLADLDLDMRRDWLDLFPFLRTRRPETYGALSVPVAGIAQ
ncbi:hydrolase [Nakamurella antarctica]|uniref:Hydrolase n=2 Tax=Nakamurella antarctica TaxID=1902245 RepID=A0A3G9A010_9ACTN|nr:hydrolase [Nakamurella antarctica]